MAYNLDYAKLPILDAISREEFVKLEMEGIIEEFGIEGNSEIGILSKTIKDEEIKERFTKVIKGRILAKTELVKKGKEKGLKNKMLERVLGKIISEGRINR